MSLSATQQVNEILNNATGYTKLSLINQLEDLDPMTKTNRYNTHLAAEFRVLSVLHRLGFSASLTLGNRKAVDIVVESKGKIRTIDVKGMAGKTVWPLDNLCLRGPKHVIALVTYLDDIDDPDAAPEVFLLPSNSVSQHLYRNPKRTRKGITYSEMRKNGARYRNAWRQMGIAVNHGATRALDNGTSVKGTYPE